MTSPGTDGFRDRLAQTIESEFGRSGFFAVTDPRDCRLVGRWRQVMVELRVRPPFGNIHRNPPEVAMSLGKRDDLNLDYDALAWRRHLLDAEAESGGRTRSFTSYDRGLGDWAVEMQKIGADLDLFWPTFTPAHGVELDAMVVPDLEPNSGG